MKWSGFIKIMSLELVYMDGVENKNTPCWGPAYSNFLKQSSELIYKYVGDFQSFE